MLGKNRDRLCIIAAILEAVNSGSNKTRIMFVANLSFKLLRKYLDIVVNAGFVKVDGSTYLLTENGRVFLRRYSNFHEEYHKTEEILKALITEHEQMARLVEKNRLFVNQ
jgi:predicted transcriptional regulator